MKLVLEKLDGLYTLSELNFPEPGKTLAIFNAETKKEKVENVKEYMKENHNQGEISVLDDDFPALVTFRNGEALYVDSEFGTYDDEAGLEWGTIAQDDIESRVDCHFCGDGGCPQCRPSWFM